MKNLLNHHCYHEMLLVWMVRVSTTDPDILRLMVNCSQMSDASRVSWGPTKPSSCSQKSLVSSTDAEKRRRGLSWAITEGRRDFARRYEKNWTFHSPSIIKQAAALIAWKAADQLVLLQSMVSLGMSLYIKAYYNSISFLNKSFLIQIKIHIT